MQAVNLLERKEGKEALRGQAARRGNRAPDLYRAQRDDVIMNVTFPWNCVSS